MATTMEIAVPEDAKVVSPSKLHTSNLLDNHPRALMDVTGTVTTKLARKIYQSRNSQTQLPYTPPTIRATREHLDMVLGILNKRITKRFTKQHLGPDNECYPAQFDHLIRHSRPFQALEDKMYAFQFLMNLSTYIMKRVLRLPQVMVCPSLDY